MQLEVTVSTCAAAESAMGRARVRAQKCRTDTTRMDDALRNPLIYRRGEVISQQ